MATDLRNNLALEIRKMPDGGYVIGDGYDFEGRYRNMHFASTSVDEALKYIKGKLEPRKAA